jgi:hypothetical protein
VVVCHRLNQGFEVVRIELRLSQPRIMTPFEERRKRRSPVIGDRDQLDIRMVQKIPRRRTALEPRTQHQQLHLDSERKKRKRKRRPN